MSDHRTHLHAAVEAGNRVQSRNPAEIDYMARRGQAKVEHRQQALPARQHHSFVTGLLEDFQEFWKRPGGVVVEPRRLHALCCPPPSSGDRCGPVHTYGRPSRPEGLQ